MACACCSELGDRFVERVGITELERGIFDEVSFATEASTTLGADYSRPVSMTVSKGRNAWTFAVTLPDGESGRLIFPIPGIVARFEVDPREPAESPSGVQRPVLYKEWKLIAKPTGEGILQDNASGDQMMALILQGRGNRCVDPADFTAWTIVLYGSRGEVTFFGNLIGG